MDIPSTYRIVQAVSTTLVLALCTFCRPAAGQSARYSWSVDDVPAGEALVALNEITRVGIVYEPSALDGTRVSCHIREAAIEELLDCMLDGTALRHRRLPSGAFTVERLQSAPWENEPTTVSSDRPPARLTGFVTDGADGQPLHGATVTLRPVDRDARPGVDAANADHIAGRRQSASDLPEDPNGSPIHGTATNADGFYLIRAIAPGRYALAVSFVGYDTDVDTLTLTARAAASRDAALSASQEMLGEVYVRAHLERASSTAGHRRIRPQDARLVPSPDVSADLAGYLATLPGTVMPADRGGQYFVRGGEPSQNLVLFDGMVVYQPFHVLGFYSVFPSDVLQQVDLYAGGFPARYAGRIASVMDVRSRNGNNRRVAGMASASPFVSTVRIEGPILPDRASFMFSARESMLDRASGPFLEDDLPFAFGDVFAKVYGPVTPSSRLAVSALRTHDRSTIGEDVGGAAPEEIRWRNEAVGVRWMFAPPLMPVVMNVSISRSRHHTEFGPETNPLRTSTIAHTRVAASASFEEGRFSWDGGWDALVADATRNLDGVFQLPEVSGEPFTEFGFYAEPAYDLGRGLRVVPSVRLQWYRIKADPYLEPRLRATWSLGAHHVAGALGMYHQEVLGITDRRDVANVFTIWSVVPRQYDQDPLAGRLGKAAHAMLGYRGSPRSWLDVSVEGFYKRLRNLYAAEWTAMPWLQTTLQPASGRSMGMEASLEVRRDPFHARLSYGLSSTRYRVSYDAVRYWFGTESFDFRPPHDRRHQLHALAGTSWQGFGVSLRWSFGSGLPYTRPAGFDTFVLLDRATSVFEMERMQRVIYDRPFNAVLPTYHRLDLSVERTMRLGAAELTLLGSLINAYDRRNLFYLDMFTMRRVDQLPIVPSFGVRVEFE